MTYAYPLSRRQAEIAALLLQGCENPEIARQLGMKLRSVKHRFTQMFKQYHIEGGVKRVKLAMLLYRRQREQERRREDNPETPGRGSHDFVLRIHAGG
jgi:DNA-binding NarL/FixJ family response regulator